MRTLIVARRMMQQQQSEDLWLMHYVAVKIGVAATAVAAKEDVSEH